MKFITEKTDLQTCIIKPGMRFQNRHKDVFILAQVQSDQYNLICLATGNRWSDQLHTLEEIASMLNAEYWQLHSK